MSAPSSTSDHSDNFDFDDLCLQFETEWLSESVPGQNVREFLELAPGDEEFQRRLAAELIAIDCELRLRDGTEPLAESYEEHLPEYRREIAAAIEWSHGTLRINQRAPEVQQLGDYRIVREIGRGAMGIVYEAIQESLNRRVAIKALTIHPLTKHEAQTRFERESRAVGTLHHTNIVDVYGIGEADGVRYFAMQLIHGKSLSRVIKGMKSTENDSRSSSASQNDHFRWAADVVRQVALALDYAHSQGVLHRDIKPSNLLLDNAGIVHITDFGLAKFESEADDLTRTGQIIGTLRYLPPESFHQQWDVRSDIFSLAATLFELLTLRPMYAANDRVNLLNIVSRCEHAAPAHINSAVPRDLDTIVRKAAARAPEKRYQTAAEFAQDLQSFLDGEPIAARRTGALEHGWKWAKRNPGSAAFVGLMALVTFVGMPLVGLLYNQSVEASVVAKEKQQEADEARHDARARAYASMIQLAGKFAEEGARSELSPLLDEAARLNTSESGGWEWNYLNQLRDTSRLTLAGHTDRARHVVFHPNGQQIASVGGASPLRTPDNRGEVILWNAATGEREHTLPGDQPGVTGAAYSPDGAQLATISYRPISSFSDGRKSRNGFIRIWNPATGEPLRTFPLRGEFNGSWIGGRFPKRLFPGIRFSSDGKSLLSWPGPVQLRDAENGEVHWERDGLEAMFFGDQVLITTESSLEVIDAMTGQVVATHDTGHLYGLERAGDSGFTAVSNRTLQLRSFPECQLIREIAPEVEWGRSLGENKFAIGDRAGNLKILSDQSTIQQIKMGHSGDIIHGSVNRDGTQIATASADGTVKVWTAAENNPKRRDTGLNTRMSALGVAGENVLFACASTAIQEGPAGKLCLTDMVSESIPLETTFAQHAPRNDMAFSNDGNFLAAPAQDDVRKNYMGYSKSGAVNVWSADPRELKASLPTELDITSCVAWSPETTLLVVGGQTGEQLQILIVEIDQKTDGSVHAKLRSQHAVPKPGQQQNSLHVVAIHPDDDRIAVADKFRVQEFDLNQNRWRVISEQGDGEMQVFSLTYSPDGSQLAVAFENERRVKVWQCADNRLAYETAAPLGVCCVNYSPDSQYLAMIGYESRVSLCNAADGCRLLTLNASRRAGKAFYAARVLFTRDGQTLIANNWQGDIVTWQANSKRRSSDAKPQRAN